MSTPSTVDIPQRQKISISRHGKMIQLLIPASLLAFVFLQCLYLAWETGQTTDEPYFNGPAYGMVRYNQYETLAEHPPLSMQLGAIPLLLLQPRYPIHDLIYVPGTDIVENNKTGLKFLYEMGNSPRLLLFFERFSIVVLTCLLGAVLFLWSQEIFGWGAGILSLTLFVFSPNILAHGSLFTTDMTATATFFFALYAFWKFLKSPNANTAAFTGIFCGLALVAKISTILLFPILLAISLFVYFLDRNASIVQIESDGLKPVPAAALALFVFVMSLGQKLILCVLGPLSLLLLQLSVNETRSSARARWMKIVIFGGWVGCMISALLLYKKYAAIAPAFSFWIAAALTLSLYLEKNQPPAPKTRMIKLFSVIWLTAAIVVILDYTDFYRTVPRLSAFRHYIRSFLISTSHSLSAHKGCFPDSWIRCDSTFFLSSLLAKTPVSVLILFLCGCVITLKSRIKMWEKAVLFLPSIFFLFVASFMNKIYIGVRHVLPIYPFMLIIAGSSVAALRNTVRPARTGSAFLLAALFAWLAFDFAKAHPDYLSYANEFAGGTERAGKYLGGGNINWGQDNRRLTEFVRTQKISFIKIMAKDSNPAEYDYYGIAWAFISDEEFIRPVPGFYALDQHYYRLQQANNQSWFHGRAPQYRVGRTFYIFEIPPPSNGS